MKQRRNNNWIYNMKYWIKTTTINPPIFYLFPISFLHLFYPSSNTINVKIYVTQPNHEWRKTNEENKTNKKNQHINNKNTKWNTLGDAPRPASGGWSIPVWSTATLMKDGIQKKTKANNTTNNGMKLYHCILTNCPTLPKWG